MLAIIKDLDEEDYFALIQFDSIIDPWKESLTKATKENVAEAVAYIREIKARGG